MRDPLGGGGARPRGDTGAATSSLAETPQVCVRARVRARARASDMTRSLQKLAAEKAYIR